MAAKLPFRLGVTLYSFNIEFYTYKRTFEDLIEKVTSLGPDQGIEVVAPQMDRGYPSLSPEFEHRFKNAPSKSSGHHERSRRAIHSTRVAQFSDIHSRQQWHLHGYGQDSRSCRDLFR